jgi:hypothetical protein
MEKYFEVKYQCPSTNMSVESASVALKRGKVLRRRQM